MIRQQFVDAVPVYTIFERTLPLCEQEDARRRREQVATRST
jgi:hypothetical protein